MLWGLDTEAIMVYAKLTSCLLNNHIITMAPAWWMQIDTDAYIIATFTFCIFPALLQVSVRGTSAT